MKHCPGRVGRFLGRAPDFQGITVAADDSFMGISSQRIGKPVAAQDPPHWKPGGRPSSFSSCSGGSRRPRPAPGRAGARASAPRATRRPARGQGPRGGRRPRRRSGVLGDIQGDSINLNQRS